MTSITSLTGPRVQSPTTNASSSVAGTRFGSLVQGGNAQAPRPGDPLSGSTVVSSALAQMGASPHGALMGSYLRGAIQGQGGQAGGQAAAPNAEETKALKDLATMSSISMTQAIIGMGNGMKVDLEQQ